MAEQTFRSPGFFDREIDLSQRQTSPSGIPAGVIGTAEMGPAFVPVTVGDFGDFQTRFGTLQPGKFGPYAVREFLKNRQACTFMRVLGTGLNKTTAQIENFEKAGICNSAGFVLTGTQKVGEPMPQPVGNIQFLCTRQFASASLEGIGFPIFSDNESCIGTAGGDDHVRLLRAVLMTASGTQFQVLTPRTDYATWRTFYGSTPGPMSANPNDSAIGSMPAFSFKLILSNSDGADFGEADGLPGLKIFTASLDPQSDNYISKILNTEPSKFQQKKHLLYVDFPVDTEVAQLAIPTGDPPGVFGTIQSPSVVLMSGSAFTSGDSGLPTETFVNLFGRFDTRFTTPKTTNFISQPFSGKEWDLFHFETLTDGAVGNTMFKISIANIVASVDESYPYPSFEVQVRDFYDTDLDPKILEKYPNVNLDRDSDRFIGRVIGDKKVSFNFDAEAEEERRLVITGRFANKSSRIRVQMADEVYNREVPKEATPFGFRGIPTLKTTDSLTDDLTTTIRRDGRKLGSELPLASTLTGDMRLAWGASYNGVLDNSLVSQSGSIVPPLPYRFKVTRGAVSTDSPVWIGRPGNDERTDSRFYWGVMNTSIAPTGTFGAGENEIFRANEGTTYNRIVDAYTKFIGIQKLDTLVTGTGADVFNNNKFTLARVALPNSLDASGHISQLTASAATHMKGAAYLRNKQPSVGLALLQDTSFDSVSTSYPGRISLATLLGSSSVEFNRFTTYAKFTNIFHGGFDGLNILNKEQGLMNDRATSNIGGGYASTSWTDTGLNTQPNGSVNPAGTSIDNSIVAAYRQAAMIMTDNRVTDINILAIPGIRSPLVTDFVADKARDNTQIFNVMDIPLYDENSDRVFAGPGIRPDVERTTIEFGLRNVDNNYSAVYFPDVHIQDNINNLITRVPPSVAALGALGFNDKNAKPWFAPAGFNRGSLEFVTNVDVRLSAADRDTLYDARINPIATFPNGGGPNTYVIFGQKNLQLAQTALDRINVRRMLIEVKRLIFKVARNLIFEQNNQATRSRFIAGASPLLALVQAQQGIEQFKIVMDDSNNTLEDIEGNRLNGRIVLVPTRTVEFIAVDFIITATGVSFE
tara:strand:+ start:58044 stop:61325 length:3282 start_codon:yes stop_codon:yes gene_type:complete